MQTRRKNLVLLGFMGTGKSTAGALVAQRAGAPFLDMDAELTRRARKSVADIFAEDGEEAFREMESKLCVEWGGRPMGAVIACGGGVPLRAKNLRVLAKHGILLCLTADLATLAARTARASERPLLRASDHVSHLRALLARREVAYGRLPIHLDTTLRTPEGTALRILDIWKREEQKASAQAAKPAGKKNSAKKGLAKPTATKKSATKKPVTKRPAVKKSAVNKSVMKKPMAKKSPAAKARGKAKT